jgi:nucleotide-binding universal stress UspA family protein
MSKVVAAIDNSAAAGPVLAVAAAFAELVGTEVEALHAVGEEDRPPKGLPLHAGVPLREVPGPAVDAILAAGAPDDVAALVLGARGTPGGRRPVGATALAVITSLAKPVVVVPPDAAPGQLGRVLVPLEGTLSTSHAPTTMLDLASARTVDVVVVHVHDEASLPSFTDQPQHETSAWAEEFVARYWPWGVDDVRLETRVGRADEEIIGAAADLGVDVIALGWEQELGAGRAEVVRAVLEHARIPVLLVPVKAATTAPDEQSEARTGLQSSPA